MAAEPGVLIADGVAVDRGRRRIVRDVDLTVDPGEIVALLGPNGAGKSTLLAAIAGLLPASAGTLRVRGRVAAALQAPAMARRSARANVEAGLAWWGVPRGERRARAIAALEQIGVGALADRRATQLSGGEARRVHLARAVAVRPDLLLLDEPFAGLDVSTRADLLYDAGALLRSPERATLLVVHDRAEAWALADRLVIVLDGRVAADGPPAHLIEHPPTAEVARFLGFEGTAPTPDGRLRLLRPAHVTVDPEGPVHGTVSRTVPLQDGVRLEIAIDGGRLVAIAPAPGLRAGDPVRVALSGGVVFDRPPVGE